MLVYEPPHDKTNNVVVRPAKTQISLGIRPVWSEPTLSAWRTLGSLATHWAHSEDSDQTGRMPRLIWVFAGRTVILLVLLQGGSYSLWLFRPIRVFLLISPPQLCIKWADARKPTKATICPSKFSANDSTVSSVLAPRWARNNQFLHAVSKDYDQTAGMQADFCWAHAICNL